MTSARNVRRRLLVAAFVIACQSAAVAQDQAPIIQPGWRVRVNSWVRLEVPEFKQGDDPTLIEIIDPWQQRIWTGATYDKTFEFLSRDWADGTYTVTFSNGRSYTFDVDTARLDTFRARAGAILNEIDKRRDPNGNPPEEFRDIGNLLQRQMLEAFYMQPNEEHLKMIEAAEKIVGVKAEAGLIRILGSGAADHNGYDAPYRPFMRERTSVFMPPNAVFDFAQNAERKLKRWGYGVKDVEHIFVSHVHADHFDAVAIADFAGKRSAAKLSVLKFYSGKASCDQLKAELEKRGKGDLVKITELEHGKEVRAGELTVKAVNANHDPKANPLCYIIRLHGTTAYYGTDTGYPPAETYEALAAEKFDVFLPEVTFIIAGDGMVHMDTHDLRLLTGRLRADGAIGPRTRVVTIHQCKLGAQIAPDLMHLQSTIGFESGYDGMPIPIVWMER